MCAGDKGPGDRGPGILVALWSSISVLESNLSSYQPKNPRLEAVQTSSLFWLNVTRTQWQAGSMIFPLPHCSKETVLIFLSSLRPSDSEAEWMREHVQWIKHTLKTALNKTEHTFHQPGGSRGWSLGLGISPGSLSRPLCSMVMSASY